MFSFCNYTSALGAAFHLYYYWADDLLRAIILSTFSFITVSMKIGKGQK
jgi:hypothetical protein